MPGRKSFAGAAPRTTLNGSITNVSTVIVVTSGTGYPSGGTNPFVIVIDRGLASEEKVLVQSRSGTSLTVASSGRGYDGTTATSHADGAYLEHVLDADTLDEANAHVNDDTRDDHSQYLNTTRHDTTARHGSAVVDHGSVGGLGDNDHPQYKLVSEFNTQFTKAGIDALGIDADTVDGSHASAFATAGHGHSFSTGISVQELIDDSVAVGINTTSTQIGSTGTISLPGGWTTMACALIGHAGISKTNKSGDQRGYFWLEAPDGTVIIDSGLRSQFYFEDVGASAVGRTYTVPLTALLPSRSADTSVSLNAVLTRGSNGEVEADYRYLYVVKYRLT